MSFKLFILAPALLSATLLNGLPAHAANREMIQLQTQIQQLQDAVARLQQSNDERMGVVKDLVQQSADQTNKVATTIDTLQRQLQGQQEAGGGKIDQVSGQVQSLNDSLDEIKARLGRLEKLMQDVQNQQQSLSAGPSTASSAAPINSPSPASPAVVAPSPTENPSNSLNDSGAPRRSSKPSAAIPADNSLNGSEPTAAANASVPPADQLYKTALGDYMAAKYGLAQSEFSDLTRAYPDNPLAGNAFYYQGEMDYRGARYGAAIKDYDRVLEQYPDSNKVPAAHLHKGQALVQLKQTDAGVREFRSLIQRFPTSPEALQARSRLSGMGVVVKPKA